MAFPSLTKNPGNRNGLLTTCAVSPGNRELNMGDLVRFPGNRAGSERLWISSRGTATCCPRRGGLARGTAGALGRALLRRIGSDQAHCSENATALDARASRGAGGVPARMGLARPTSVR